MSDLSLYEPYDPFVALLRNGQFSAPADGWSAELIGAHIARATDHMAALVDQVLAGETPAFDNRDDVNEGELREYIEAHGGVGALADTLDGSARELAAVAAALDDGQRDTPITVMLVDNGVVVVDQPIPLGALLQTHVNLHLSGHLEQLQALADG
ncbi:MAG: maleylpyruvate isomerase N-terminal domain-containing protein [Acidimicrobiales bacterium]